VSITVALLGMSVVLWFWATQPLLLPGPVNPIAPASPMHLETHVRTLAETCAPRDTDHPETLECAAAYIRGTFEKAGGSVTEQVFMMSDGVEYRNVIAMFGPVSDERIIVGAHYDAVIDSPAADDNASGVAGLIELAYLLGKTDLPLQVELVAHTLEEYGYVGSQRHATRLELQEARVRAVIIIDMIGYFKDEPHTQEGPSLLRPFYPTTGNWILIAGKWEQGWLARRVKQAMRRESVLPVHSVNLPPWMLPKIAHADHQSYWEAGYSQAILVTDTADFRNENYHTPTDTSETLDYERMEMVVRGLYAAIQSLGR